MPRTPTCVLRFAAAALAWCLFISPGIAADGARERFAVPAGEAEQTLKSFSEQARVHLLFPTELVAGVRTRAVAGIYSPGRALAIMLAGTDLIASHDEVTGVVTIRRFERPPSRRTAIVPHMAKPSGAVAADGPIELSPFTVTSDKDVGYLAGNSLSGSRMDLRLKDTAASISVLTEEFIRDVGAFNLSEALVFGSNTTLDLGEAGEFGSTQELNARIEFEQRYRVRGLPATVARNYFKWTVPTDTFNVGRVEESRGPNSILFGVGSAGGIINVSTKQALIGHTLRSFVVAAGSHDSRRASIDLNQPWQEANGGVRFNAVWDRSNSFRHYAFSENRRVHVALKYRPTAQTQVRIEGEHGTVKGNVPRTGAISDRSLPWIEAGRPTFASTAPAEEFSDYGTRLGATQLRYISNTNQLLDMTGQILTAVPGPNMEITDPRHVDPSINTGGPGQVRSNRFTTYSAYLEHQLARRTFAEIAFNYQRYRFASFDPINSNSLFGDPNRALPATLGANPFAGASLLETNWRYFQRSEQANTSRASLSSEFDLGRWGLYRAAVLGEYQKNRYQNRNAFETWEGAPFNPTPESSANRVTRRSYITLNDWATYYVNGPATTGLIRNMIEPVTGRQLTSTWIPSTSVNDDITAQRSLLLGLQAAYFDGRLVGGAGYRFDRLVLKDRGIARNPATRIWEVDYQNVTLVKDTGHTTTLGLAGHVSKHVSLLYNQSKNIEVPNPNIRVMPDVAVGHPPRGEGRDYGLAVDLFDGKAYARAIRFTTDYKGERGFGGAVIGTHNNRMLNGLLAAGEITQAEYDARHVNEGVNGRTRNKAADGYEFSLTANPTQQWRLQANFSITEGVESEIAPEVVEWWKEARAYFEAFPQDIPTGIGANTIGSTIAIFQDTIDGWRSAEGIGLVGNRKYKANVFTRYTFISSPVKGLFIGGGYRYLGRMLVGRTDAGVLQYAPSHGEGSFVAGRTLRLRSGHELRIQLNILNLFDETDPIIVRYRSSGNTTQPQQVILRSPRTWRLSFEYSF